MSSLLVVEPIQITDADVVSSNVPETDFLPWSSTTSYAAGDRVILASTHSVYQSLQAGNLNKPPEAETTWWVAVRPTNRWAVFDTSNSTKTTVPSGQTKISYEIKASLVNSVSILNISGAGSATVSVRNDAGIVIYAKTVSLTSVQSSSDWWAWFFGERKPKSQVVLTDLQMQLNATISIDLYGGADLSVGVILLGRLRSFGKGVLSGARVGIQDYSRKERNDFGDMIIVERAFARRANLQIVLGANEVDSMIDFMSTVRAKPCLWIAGTYESLVIFGFYKSFETLIPYATHSEFSLELEGLT